MSAQLGHTHTGVLTPMNYSIRKPVSAKNADKRTFDWAFNTPITNMGRAVLAEANIEPRSNPDELFKTLKLPATPATALRLFLSDLSMFERGEILDYSDIYFLGLKA